MEKQDLALNNQQCRKTKPMQTKPNLISTRRPDLMLIYKKIKKKENILSCRFCRSNGPRNENQTKEKNRQICGPYQGTKKLESQVTVIPIVVGTLGMVRKAFDRELEQ